MLYKKATPILGTRNWTHNDHLSAHLSDHRLVSSQTIEQHNRIHTNTSASNTANTGKASSMHARVLSNPWESALPNRALPFSLGFIGLRVCERVETCMAECVSMEVRGRFWLDVRGLEREEDKGKEGKVEMKWMILGLGWLWKWKVYVQENGRCYRCYFDHSLEDIIRTE